MIYRKHVNIENSTFDRLAAFVNVFLFGFLFISPTIQAATQAEIDASRINAIAWLISNQQGDGSWRSTDNSAIQSTAGAVQALSNAGVTGFSYVRGLAWLANTEASNVDSLSRQIIAMSDAGMDTQEKLDKLIAWRNRKSSWGAYDRYSTSFPDTPLASSAIRSDATTFSTETGALLNAVCEIVKAQKTGGATIDGSWSYMPPVDVALSSLASSAVLPTVYNLLEISAYIDLGYTSRNCSGTVYNFNTVINSGLNWLLTQRMNVADGGFGDDSISNVLDTALAYLAIAKLAPGDPSLTAAQDYLINAQSIDGSWSGDALVTAVAAGTFSPLILADFDKDGIPDSVEIVLGTNPAVADSRDFATGNGRSASPIILQDYVAITLNTFTRLILKNAGGVKPYNWNLASGSLPTGLNLFANAGEISGSPQSTGLFNFTYSAVDAYGKTVLVEAQINVLSPFDSDGDGMNDIWETLQFGSLDQNGIGDYDGDGVANLLEYQLDQGDIATVTNNLSLITDDVNGVDGSNDDSYRLAISADGRYVGFDSTATNLIAGGNSFAQNVFVHDTQTDLTTLVSKNKDGTDGGNALSTTPYLSNDGRYVVFSSNASDIVLNDNNGNRDVFLYDMQLNTMKLVSKNNAGTGSANGASFAYDISADGRYIAYESSAADIVANDSNGTYDIYIYDAVTDITILASKSKLGTGTANSASKAPSLSSDGRYVTFYSSATDMASTDTDTKNDVFIYDRVTNVTALVSINTSLAGSGNGNSWNAKISKGANYVTFSSTSSDLVLNDTNNSTDVFLYDVTTSQITLVSKNTTGTGTGNGYSYSPMISSNGQFVTYSSQASDLVSADTNANQDIFLYDSQLDSNVLVSSNVTGIDSANGYSTCNTISSDGRYILFSSSATNITLISNNEGPETFDAFIYDRLSGTAVTVSTNGIRTGGACFTTSTNISADGKKAIFDIDVPNLVAKDTNSFSDIFLWVNNSSPAVINDTVATIEDTQIIIDVLLNDSDDDLDELTIVSVITPDYGFVEITEDKKFITYTPKVNWVGSDVFIYIVSDGRGGIVSGTVTVNVTSNNDLPLTVNDKAVTNEGVPVNIMVIANDSDIDGDTLNISSASLPANGTVSISPDYQSITYTPSNQFSGIDSFTYTVNDGNGGLVIGTVVVNVTSLVDTDGDGIQDFWELLNYGSLVTDGSLDFDSDGYSDITELNAGTDPLDPLSIPSIADGDLAPLGAPDGVLNAADYLIAQRIVLGQITATALELSHGDVYPPGAPDGVINVSDLILIQKLVLQ